MQDEAAYIIHTPGYDANGALQITVSEGNSLNEMVDASLASFEEEYETFEVISDRRISIRGVEARETVSVLDWGFGEFKGKGVGLVSGDLYYRASFAVIPELYEFFEPVWDVVFASFTLQGDASPTLTPPANSSLAF